jgi:hypothetical protein
MNVHDVTGGPAPLVSSGRVNSRGRVVNPDCVVSPGRVVGDTSPRRPPDTRFVTGHDACRDDRRVDSITHAMRDAVS